MGRPLTSLLVLGSAGAARRLRRDGAEVVGAVSGRRRSPGALRRRDRRSRSRRTGGTRSARPRSTAGWCCRSCPRSGARRGPAKARPGCPGARSGAARAGHGERSAGRPAAPGAGSSGTAALWPTTAARTGAAAASFCHRLATPRSPPRPPPQPLTARRDDAPRSGAGADLPRAPPAAAAPPQLQAPDAPRPAPGGTSRGGKGPAQCRPAAYACEARAWVC